ncbi:MAG TPA: IPT/TIG domain-containing protein [Thermoanaerobaculia bacterium]|nr:IPT/TIG domain-containing protein [Thermoanaerobaculia bacterium]
MKTMRNSKTLLALFALLLVLGACKGESPTAPPSGGGIPGGGNPNPTPTGIDVTLTSTNANPLVDSTVTITANVTQNGQPAPNGTAVEFSTTRGSFDNTTATAVIKTTTSGLATVTLTSATAGLARVTAIVNNVQRSIDVTFQTRPVTPPPPNTTPTITSVTPSIGRPSGGETIRITGTNFRTPVRVLFDVGAALPVEATVVSVTPTAIEVITPGVNITVAQELIADIIVLTEAGTAAEQRVELTGAFTYRNERLQPQISTATPNSGPITGGTIVTIFGDGFQAPVQVLFGAAEARVITVDFSKIMVEAPAGRDTSETGNLPVTGFVPILVRNINSQTEDLVDDAFRYVNQIAITAVGPGGSPFTGGQRVTIDGTGFVAPVVINVRTGDGDLSLQPISVSGTRIIAITPAIDIDNCEDVTGDLIVTNVQNGDQAEGPPFTFFVTSPLITNVSPNAVEPGENIFITVANAQAGVVRVELGDRAVFPSSVTFDEETGVAVYTVPVPVNFEFPTEACSINGVEGEREIAFQVDVTYTNASTDCTDTAADALTILPEGGGACEVPPSPEAGMTVDPTNGAGCAVPPDQAAAAGTSVATITFSNSGTAPLTVTAGTVTGANAEDFTITPAQRTVAAGTSQDFTVTFDPSDVGARNGSVSFTTNDPDEGTIIVCLQGNGT